MTARIREQYERFPYPPIPWIALPRRGQGAELRFELGTRLAFGAEHSHAGIRILVAGAGTFEALLVAQAHPLAREVVAVDLSENSLRRLRRRVSLFRFARPFTRIPPIRIVRADLQDWKPDAAGFDYVIASNLLQHVDDPSALLQRLAGWLAREGILRIVTYPRASRIWMRETTRFLRHSGMTQETPALARHARDAIRSLPLSSPIRSCYVSQPETKTSAGLIDAFFNARENPLAPLQWREAALHAGLALVGDTQEKSSRSDFLIELFPETARLDRWTRLQVLDDLLELCANPILWFRKTSPGEAQAEPSPFAYPLFPGEPKREIAENLRRVFRLLGPLGISMPRIFETLKKEVGPRIGHFPKETALPGMALSDYSCNDFKLD